MGAGAPEWPQGLDFTWSFRTLDGMMRAVGARAPWIHLLAPFLCVIWAAVTMPVRAQETASQSGDPAEASEAAERLWQRFRAL